MLVAFKVLLALFTVGIFVLFIYSVEYFNSVKSSFIDDENY